MALNLGITLDNLYAMSSKEYMGWIKYFNERPIGWREDHRTAVIAQTTYQGKKKLQINDIFPALKILEDNIKSKDNYIKNHPFILKMKQVAKKNKIDWLGEKNKKD